jgi:DNA end-binding protein Ku
MRLKKVSPNNHLSVVLACRRVWSISLVPRAHWKGFLKLSLVSCPVALYPAVAASERISFRQVNKQTGNRLRQQLVDAVTGEKVPSLNKGRGYEIAENEFLLVRDEELEEAKQEARTRPYTAAPPKISLEDVVQSEPPPALPRARRFTAAPMKSIPRRQEEPRAHEEPIASHTEPQIPARRSAILDARVPFPTPIENNRTIQIDRFIPRAQVDARYLDTPYYVVPRDEVGQEAFAVIRDAMRGKNVVGMGRVVFARRERPIIVEPMGDGIRGITLRYSHEVRDETGYFANIQKLELPDEMLRVAEHIVETKTSDFDPAYLEDRYRTVLIAKLQEKHVELPKKIGAVRPAPENVISLMDVLKRSLTAERPAASLPATKPTARRMATPSKGSPSKRSNARSRPAS